MVFIYNRTSLTEVEHAGICKSDRAGFGWVVGQIFPQRWSASMAGDGKGYGGDALPQELGDELTLVTQVLFPKDSQELRWHLVNQHFCVCLVH